MNLLKSFLLYAVDGFLISHTVTMDLEISAYGSLLGGTIGLANKVFDHASS